MKIMNFFSFLVFAVVVFSAAVADIEFSDPADPFDLEDEYTKTDNEEAERGALGCRCNIYNIKKPANSQNTCDESIRTVNHPGVGEFSNQLACHRRGFPPDSPAKIDTKFVLYTKKDICVGRELVLGRNDTLVDVSPGKPTKFITHGFSGSATNKWVQYMKDALLKKGDFNVITVDWAKGAFKGGDVLRLFKYCRARQNIRVVARQVANLLKQIKSENSSFQYSDVHLIGHSLGGQMSGYVGQELAGIGRISALDPAKPDFEGHVSDCRVDKSDANFVDAIHSNTRFLGIRQEVGHVDFYVNGGYSQGCGEWYKFGSDVDICSHSLAYKYFTDSVSNGCNAKAYPCGLKSWKDTCQHTGEAGVSGVHMGYEADSTPSSKYGSYLMFAKKKAPYCDPSKRP